MMGYKFEVGTPFIGNVEGGSPCEQSVAGSKTVGLVSKEIQNCEGSSAVSYFCFPYPKTDGLTVKEPIAFEFA